MSEVEPCSSHLQPGIMPGMAYGMPHYRLLGSGSCICNLRLCEPQSQSGPRHTIDRHVASGVNCPLITNSYRSSATGVTACLANTDCCNIMSHGMFLPFICTGARPAAPPSTATWLASALPSSTRVVKAFNNLSAYTLIHGDPLTEHMKSVAASNDSEAATTVAAFGRALGLEVGGWVLAAAHCQLLQLCALLCPKSRLSGGQSSVSIQHSVTLWRTDTASCQVNRAAKGDMSVTYDLHPALLQMRVVLRLSYASTLEGRQHSLLPAWQWPAWLMFWTWLIVHVYSFIRYNLYGGTPWQHVTMWVSHQRGSLAHVWSKR